jgi:hypothetical protein
VGAAATTSAIWRSAWRSRAWWIGALAVAFPLLRLWPLDGQFFLDWANHKWLAGYSGEYLRHHGTVPIVLNTTGPTGMPYPVFYGSLFYPALALLTSWLSPDLVVRVVVVVVTWLELRCVSVALERYEVPPWIARAIACIVIWATYPLTNLYHRAAIPEYVATALLTCIVASWFALLRAELPAERRRLALAIGLQFALCAGTHPITALYSLPIIALLAASAWAERGRDRAFWWDLVRTFVVPVSLIVVVLAPWLYALVQFQSHLQITTDTLTGAVLFDANDHLATRFMPIPYDSRDLADIMINAPYLETQVNVAALVLVVGWLVVLARQGRGAAIAGVRATVLCFALFAVFVWMSVSPMPYELLPSLAKMLQIAYRAVTYQNLAILVATFMVVAVTRRRGDSARIERSRGLAVVVLACVVLSATGVVLKLLHATRTMTTDGSVTIASTAAERASWIAITPRFYGYSSYSTPSLYSSSFGPVHRGELVGSRVPVGSGDEFGEPKPLRFNVTTDVWLVTSIEAFPWNHIVLDDREVPPEELRVMNSLLAVRAPAGAHRLELHTEADTAWIVLRDVSFAVAAAWLAAVLWLGARARLRRNGARTGDRDTSVDAGVESPVAVEVAEEDRPG